MRSVIWKPGPEGVLANLWMDAPDRNAVARAADEIDALLAKDPRGQGESREENVRVMFVPPLAALYEISEPDRMVCVLKIWITTPPE